MPIVPRVMMPSSPQTDSGLAAALAASVADGNSRSEPLWKGPEVDGITQGLLARFLCCRERFRLLVVEGWKPVDHFNSRIEYGNLWHICEEALAEGVDPWERVHSYTTDLCDKYPTDREDINHYYNICKTTFPLYVEYWSKHPDAKDRTPLMQEQVFDVPYRLPSGRTVRLRGKWDSVDLIGKDKDAGIYLQENKTKGTIDARKIGQQLLFDLQTQFYLIALGNWWSTEKAAVCSRVPDHWVRQEQILGVRYNVIRRSMHRLTAKDGTYENFNTRLADMIREKSEEWFQRWKVEITPGDIKRFQQQTLDPVLEQLCDWWEWMREDPSSPWDARDGRCGPHFRFPSGIYNPMTEGGESEVDDYLNTGSTAGLCRTDDLFPELKE